MESQGGTNSAISSTINLYYILRQTSGHGKGIRASPLQMKRPHFDHRTLNDSWMRLVNDEALKAFIKKLLSKINKLH